MQSGAINLVVGVSVSELYTRNGKEGPKDRPSELAATSPIRRSFFVFLSDSRVDCLLSIFLTSFL